MSSASVMTIGARLLSRASPQARTAFLPARARVPMLQARSVSLSSVGSRGTGSLAARRRPLVSPAAAAARRTSLRCLAGTPPNEKSWSEIASEAAELGKDLAKKVTSSVSKAVSAISEKAEQRPARRERERERGREELYRPEDLGFGGGVMGRLMGKAVTSVLKSAVGALGEQIREQADAVADVQDRAAAIIESSSKVRERLGGSVRVGPAFSQSSSSSWVNGKASKKIVLMMPVEGARGQAQAQVEYSEGEAANQQLNVAVRMPSGEVLQLGGGSGGAGGSVIDVEWKSVD